MKRLVAIGLIWFGCAVAWMILGSTLVARSGEASSALTQEVHLLWGPPMQQKPPSASYRETRVAKDEPAEVAPKPAPVVPAGAPRAVDTRAQAEPDPTANKAAEAPAAEKPVDVPISASDITVALALQQREKGLLWFPTYAVDFRARYTFTNTSSATREIHVAFPLQEQNVVYDGFQVQGDDGASVDAVIRGGAAEWSQPFGAGQSRSYLVSYRSRGTSQWHYQLTGGTGQVKSFRLAMKTDFADVNFLPGTLSPTMHHSARGGAWEGEWAFSSLIANAPIGIELPQKTNPGPLASRITFFAPLGLLFFFFVIAISATYKRKSIHPLNYFFFGCGFFAFHLLFAYLVDHLPIAPSFAISSAVSVALVVSYARLFTGWTFALREMGISQMIYLVLFSLTFLWTGFTGLSITVGAILSLFVMMQLTGRANWSAIDGALRPTPPPT